MVCDERHEKACKRFDKEEHMSSDREYYHLIRGRQAAGASSPRKLSRRTLSAQEYHILAQRERD
jgi:hypothetical protein